VRFLSGIVQSAALAVLMFGTASASAPPPSPDLSLTESLYSVRINGELESQGSILLTDRSGRLYARSAELAQWRFPTRPSNEIIRFKGVSYVPLASYAGLTARIDTGAQEVEITVPVDDFATTRVQVRNTASVPLTEAQAGSYLNYAFHAAGGTAAPSSVNGLFDLGMSERSGGSLSASAFTNSLPNSAHFVRLDTAWQIDNPDKHQSIHIGDFVTQPRSLGVPIRFGGLSFGTDFSSDPQFITFPTPNLNGLASLPSTVDVFLNNSQASSNLVPPGPYDVGSLPVVNGLNQAQVVVRDIAGNEHVVTLGFYESSSLLKPGLSDYTFQAGAERLNYGTNSASYGPSFLTGTWRQGISEVLTAEGHAESMGASRNCGLNLTTILKDSGTLSTGFEQSFGPTDDGRLAQIGYEYRGSAFSAFTQFQAADEDFWQLGNGATAARPKQLLQGGLSFEVGNGQLSFTDVKRTTWDGTTQQIALIGFTRNIRHGSISISYAPSVLGRPSMLTAVLISTLAPSESVVASTTLQGGKTSQGLGIESGLPADGAGTAIDFQEQSGDVKSYFVQGTQQTQATDVSLDLSSLDNSSSVDADLSGAIVLIDGKAHATRQVTGPYGLVSVPGYPGVGVLLNNRKIGETDKHGDLVVNNLEPFNGNQISLDPRSLPISANIASVDLTIVPSRAGVVAVRFATQKAGGVRITVVDSGGRPLPPGTVIEDAGSIVWPVAEDGDAYLAGINPGSQSLTAIQGASRCQFTVEVPDDILGLPNLGKFTCEVGHQSATDAVPRASHSS
jgi:outer membrane usher protein